VGLVSLAGVEIGSLPCSSEVMAVVVERVELAAMSSLRYSYVEIAVVKRPAGAGVDSLPRNLEVRAEV